MPIDRRTQRSTLRDEAAKLYLRRLAHRMGLRAVAVADPLGLLVAGAGEASLLESLAAAGALNSEPGGAWREFVREFSDPGEFSCTPIDVGGLSLCVAALGDGAIPAQDVGDALSRILLN